MDNQVGDVWTSIVNAPVATLLASSKELKDEWVASIDAEIIGATQQEEAQDKRITSTVSEKVATSKLELEKRMSNMFSDHKAMTSSSSPLSTSASDDDLVSSSAPPSTTLLSSTSSNGSSGEGGAEEAPGGQRKSMSLRDKRIMLMNQAKKNPSGGALTSASVVISTDK